MDELHLEELAMPEAPSESILPEGDSAESVFPDTALDALVAAAPVSSSAAFASTSTALTMIGAPRASIPGGSSAIANAFLAQPTKGRFRRTKGDEDYFYEVLETRRLVVSVPGCEKSRSARKRAKIESSQPDDLLSQLYNGQLSAGTTVFASACDAAFTILSDDGYWANLLGQKVMCAPRTQRHCFKQDVFGGTDLQPAWVQFNPNGADSGTPRRCSKELSDDGQPKYGVAKVAVKFRPDVEAKDKPSVGVYMLISVVDPPRGSNNSSPSGARGVETRVSFRDDQVEQLSHAVYDDHEPRLLALEQRLARLELSASLGEEHSRGFEARADARTAAGLSSAVYDGIEPRLLDLEQQSARLHSPDGDLEQQAPTTLAPPTGPQHHLQHYVLKILTEAAEPVDKQDIRRELGKLMPMPATQEVNKALYELKSRGVAVHAAPSPSPLSQLWASATLSLDTLNGDSTSPMAKGDSTWPAWRLCGSTPTPAASPLSDVDESD